MEYLNYFYNTIDNNNLPDSKLKSGKIAEKFFESLFNEVFESMLHKQEKYKNFRFDLSSNYVIYEIKNYLYDSTGTADEKILHGMYKYENEVYTNRKYSKYKDVIFILCAKLENIFYDKYLSTLIKHGILEQLYEKNVFIRLQVILFQIIILIMIIKICHLLNG